MTRAFVVCGSPGAGKTTYARGLAAGRGAALLDIDTATERLVQLALQQTGKDVDDRDSFYFKEHFRAPIYETLFDLAQENLAHVDVVIVGPFTRELRDRSWPAFLATRLGSTNVEIHLVRCAPDERRERLRTRNNPRDDSKLQAWEEHRRHYGPEDPPLFDHVLVDTTNR